MKKLMIVAAVLVIGFLLIQYSRRDFLEFSERREDWKRRCSAYVGSGATLTDTGVTARCNQELAELLAYAKRKGWSN